MISLSGNNIIQEPCFLAHLIIWLKFNDVSTIDTTTINDKLDILHHVAKSCAEEIGKKA